MITNPLIKKQLINQAKKHYGAIDISKFRKTDHCSYLLADGTLLGMGLDQSHSDIKDLPATKTFPSANNDMGYSDINHFMKYTDAIRVVYLQSVSPIQFAVPPTKEQINTLAQLAKSTGTTLALMEHAVEGTTLKIKSQDATQGAISRACESLFTQKCTR